MPHPDNAIASFSFNPDAFIDNNQLTIAGGTHPRTYWWKIVDRDFNPSHNSNKFRISVTQNGIGSAKFQAINVAMYPSNGPMNWQYLPDSGSLYLVTGQLTGCSFAIRKDAFGLAATHLQPTGGEDGAALRKRLNKMREKDTSIKQIWGATDYDAKNNFAGTVIGVRIAKTWMIYGQKWDRGNRMINKVVQLY